jgi:hypothetical protein
VTHDAFSERRLSFAAAAGFTPDAATPDAGAGARTPLEAESEPGKGTTFTLLLPALDTGSGRALG